jgi:hypothetical protein
MVRIRALGDRPSVGSGSADALPRKGQRPSKGILGASRGHIGGFGEKPDTISSQVDPRR